MSNPLRIARALFTQKGYLPRPLFKLLDKKIDLIAAFHYHVDQPLLLTLPELHRLFDPPNPRNFAAHFSYLTRQRLAVCQAAPFVFTRSLRPALLDAIEH